MDRILLTLALAILSGRKNSETITGYEIILLGWDWDWYNPTDNELKHKAEEIVFETFDRLNDKITDLENNKSIK